MSDADKNISKKMQEQWDRRIRHDYRFWMSDGYKSDAEMWQSGERDFAIVSKDVENSAEKTCLEIGCGVGRMLKAASLHFKKVIGIDVSTEAIVKAKELLLNSSNIELHVGNGINLEQIPNGSIDFLWSFAAITSMPAEVIARYLLEMRRVLKPDGIIRLQLYLGDECVSSSEDTLHLRCFNRENLVKAFAEAGLKTEAITELILPFKVSFKEIGIEAFILTANPDGEPKLTAKEIEQVLLPGGEISDSNEISSTDIEFWMAANYAEQLVNEGDTEHAQRTLEYALAHAKSTNVDVQDILFRITSKLAPKDSEWGGEIFEKNFKALKEKFPNLAGKLQAGEQVSVKQTKEGPALFFKGQCLDHPDKPVAAAKSWVERTLSEDRNKNTEHLAVIGFGNGYHLEALLEKGKQVSCVEPELEIIYRALGTRDLTKLISQLQFFTDPKDLEWLEKGGDLAVRPQSLITNAQEVNEIKSAFYGNKGLALLKPRIAVVGPLQGGTLPIAQYAYNSFLQLGQRARGVDLSGFNPGWQLLDSMLKDRTRKNAVHAAYIETLSFGLLESFNEKPVDIVICLAQAPVTPRVLMELRKRGIVTVLWFVEDYLRFTYWKETAQFFDFVFTIQKGDCLTELKKAGAGVTHYLPTACDPGVHGPVALSPEEKARWGSSVSFVGAGYHNRQQMFASLSNLDFKIWGTEWPGCRPFDKLVQEEGRRLQPEEYVKIFNSTDINLNLHSSTERDGVDPFGDFLNPRVFELAASGAFQLVDERTLLPEAFEVGKEVITFNNTRDLKEKISYYQAHTEERTKVTEAARTRVLRDHTYHHRLAEMLKVIYSTKFEQLKGATSSGVWKQMINRSKDKPELQERCEKAQERGEEATLDALVSDIVTGNGKLSETEQKLLFLFHIRKQIIRMTKEETGER